VTSASVAVARTLLDRAAQVGERHAERACDPSQRAPLRVGEAALDAGVGAERQPDFVSDVFLVPSAGCPQLAEYLCEGRIGRKGRHAWSVLTMRGGNKAVNHLWCAIYRVSGDATAEDVMASSLIATDVLNREQRPTSVIGLVPRAVRIDLEPCQLPTLLDELFTTIEPGGGSLREAHERERLIATEDVSDAGALLHEYARILVDLGAESRRSVVDTAVSLTTPLEIADDLVRACARNACEELAALTRERGSDRTAVSAAAQAAAAWSRTLVDFRYLDEEGPDDSGL
jgi:hypothetical protein